MPVCTSSPPRTAKRTTHPAVLAPRAPVSSIVACPRHTSHTSHQSRQSHLTPVTPVTPQLLQTGTRASVCVSSPCAVHRWSTVRDPPLKTHSVAYGNLKLYAWGDGTDSKEKIVLIHLCAFPDACELEELLHQQKRSLSLADQISLF